MDDKKVAMAISLLNDSKHSVDDVRKTLKISRPTIYRYLKNNNKIT